MSTYISQPAGGCRNNALWAALVVQQLKGGYVKKVWNNIDFNRVHSDIAELSFWQMGNPGEKPAQNQYRPLRRFKPLSTAGAPKHGDTLHC